jgi:hypothetical protein
MRKAAGVHGRPTTVMARIRPARIHSEPEIQPPRMNQRMFSRKLMMGADRSRWSADSYNFNGAR